MRLRRVFSAFVAALLLAVLMPPVVALADANVTIDSVSVNPTSLDGAGGVVLTVKASVAQNSADGITGAFIGKGGQKLSEPINIAPGEQQTITCPLPVSADELGKKMNLQLAWDGGGAIDFTVTVNATASAEPSVSFSRSFSKSAAAKGDTVTISYKITNTGSVELTNLLVTDNDLEDVTLTHPSLAPGKTRTLTYDKKVDADFTSTPKLTYTANGKTYTKTLPSKTVSLLDAKVNVVLEASKSEVASGDEISLDCTITNAGNLDLTSITVSDDTLGSKLYTSSSLKAGAKKSFSKSVTLTETTKFRFVVKAKGADGNSYTFNSNSETVKVTDAEATEPAANYDLEILASSDTLQLSQPGDVNFTITVNNKSDASVADVKVVDQDDQIVKEFDILPVGENQFTYSASVTETKEFNFYAVIDGENGEYRVASGPVEITVAGAEATATPVASVEPSPTVTPAASSGGSLGSLMVALAVVGVLIIITAVVLVAMIVKDRKQRSQAPRRR